MNIHVPPLFTIPLDWRSMNLASVGIEIHFVSCVCLLIVVFFFSLLLYSRCLFCSIQSNNFSILLSSLRMLCELFFLFFWFVCFFLSFFRLYTLPFDTVIHFNACYGLWLMFINTHKHIRIQRYLRMCRREWLHADSERIANWVSEKKTAYSKRQQQKYEVQINIHINGNIATIDCVLYFLFVFSKDLSHSFIRIFFFLLFSQLLQFSLHFFCSVNSLVDVLSVQNQNMQCERKNSITHLDETR